VTWRSRYQRTCWYREISLGAHQDSRVWFLAFTRSRKGGTSTYNVVGKSVGEVESKSVRRPGLRRGHIASCTETGVRGSLMEMGPFVVGCREQV
jgi:hypothetical protein